MLGDAIKRTKRVLGIPSSYLCGIVPGSDTGAMEMAMWSVLGERPVDILAWEAFGRTWLEDVCRELKVTNVRALEAPYGDLPDFTAANWRRHDVIFTLNGTTSGVCVPHRILFHEHWFSPSAREGLVICDATSGVFSMEIPWEKLDITTFSWQKAIGGEGGHGVIVLSPRAVARLERFKPARPIPKIMRLVETNKEGRPMLLRSLFEGNVINTPSMLCVADYIDALVWAESIGGAAGCASRCRQNFDVIDKAISDSRFNHGGWLRFLALNQECRSPTSVCLTLWESRKGVPLSSERVKDIVSLLEREQVAYDIGSYSDAPAGIRIWCGGTVESRDIILLLQWLKWAYCAVVGRSGSSRL
jgi:phosphoserine aminotransferase